MCDIHCDVSVSKLKVDLQAKTLEVELLEERLATLLEATKAVVEHREEQLAEYKQANIELEQQVIDLAWDLDTCENCECCDG